MEEEHIVEHVKKISTYLEEQLDTIVKKEYGVKERRGKGLMQGLVLEKPVGDVVKKAMEYGLIVISAGGNVLRMVPPLIITEEQVDEMMEKLKKALKDA
jgi:acetylornithine/N-succinyldiaminopimelate aminotransferase